MVNIEGGNHWAQLPRVSSGQAKKQQVYIYVCVPCYTGHLPVQGKLTKGKLGGCVCLCGPPSWHLGCRLKSMN